MSCLSDSSTDYDSEYSILHTDKLDVQQINKIYSELKSIGKRLQNESALLSNRKSELEVRERQADAKELALAETLENLRSKENYLRISQQKITQLHRDLNAVVNLQVKEKISDKEDYYDVEINKLQLDLREKTRECKRLKSNFDTVRSLNEVLKSQLADAQETNIKLDSQLQACQGRLNNLLRLNIKSSRKCEAKESISKETLPKLVPSSTSIQDRQITCMNFDCFNNVICILLEWICDVQLSKGVEVFRSYDEYISEFTLGRTLKILPLLMDIISPQNSNVKSHLPILRCIYFSIIYLETVNKKSTLSSTLRRIGQELYGGGSERSAIFYNSGNAHVRFLSSLIILKTFSQDDILARVLEAIRSDTKVDSVKELFLHYQANSVMLPFLFVRNKVLLSLTLDIFLQMAIESSFLNAFLDSLSCEEFFKQVSVLISTGNKSLDQLVLEKCSIILQKLSKIKSNKRYFELHKLVPSLENIYKDCDDSQGFLALNLRSTLFSLGVNLS